MNKAIPLGIRKKVIARACERCEYCLLSEKVSFYTFHVDHIRSVKHGGKNDLENLAYCCPDCNYSKGSNVGTFAQDDETLIRFYNPRLDRWEDHFLLENGAIHGLTSIGRATEQIFRFNDVERLIFRKQLMIMDLYPHIRVI